MNDKNSGNSQLPVILTEEQFEAELAKLVKDKRALWLGVVGGVLAAVGLLIQIPVIIIVAFALIFASVFVSSKQSGKRRKLISDNIIISTLNSFFALESYNPEAYLDTEKVKEADFIDDWDRVRGGDVMSGNYRGVKFTLANVILYKVTYDSDSEGGVIDRQESRFQGQWIICRLKKYIESPVRVIEQYADNTGVGSNFGGVETGDADFNRRFCVYADDPHTASDILTPQFINCVKSADAAAQGRIRLCFSGDEVQIAIENNRKLFVIPIKENDINVLRASVQNDARYITNILDELFKNDLLF